VIGRGAADGHLGALLVRCCVRPPVGAISRVRPLRTGSGTGGSWCANTTSQTPDALSLTPCCDRRTTGSPTGAGSNVMHKTRTTHSRPVLIRTGRRRFCKRLDHGDGHRHRHRHPRAEHSSRAVHAALDDDDARAAHRVSAALQT
jgi:hypothetical protein